MKNLSEEYFEKILQQASVLMDQNTIDSIKTYGLIREIEGKIELMDDHYFVDEMDQLMKKEYRELKDQLTTIRKEAGLCHVE